MLATCYQAPGSAGRYPSISLSLSLSLFFKAQAREALIHLRLVLFFSLTLLLVSKILAATLHLIFVYHAFFLPAQLT